MKLVKKSVGLLLSVVLAIGLTACGEEPDYSVVNIQQAGVLRVAVPDYETSMFYYDAEAEDYRGTEAEVIDIIATAIGVPVEYTKFPKESLATAVLSGSADLAIGQIHADDMETQGVATSITYGSEKLYVVTPRGILAGDLKVFEDQGVGVSSRLTQKSFEKLIYVPGVTLSTFNNSDTVIGALSYGNIRGYVCYESEANYIVENGDFQIQSTPGLLDEQFVIIMDPSKTNLIIGTNSKIKAFLNGEVTASWIVVESDES